MNSTERPRSRHSRMIVEDLLGQVGGQRGGDLVEQQQLRVVGQRPGEVEHAQRRQRQVA